MGGARPHFSTGLSKVDPLPPHPEEDVDADVDQQGDNEGQVEGHHRGVDHKVRVGDGAHHGVVCGKKKKSSRSQFWLGDGGTLLQQTSDPEGSLSSFISCTHTELCSAAQMLLQGWSQVQSI